MDNIDLTLPTSTGKFNYRVGAIILNAGSVLMANNSGSSHYYSVGGRVKFGESLHDAVLREVFEETKENLEIDRLAYIHENFFLWGSEQVPFHELAFFFLMKGNERINQKTFERLDEEYGAVSLCWLPLTELASINLYPEFFKSELKLLVHSDLLNVRHFVTKNNITSRML